MTRVHACHQLLRHGALNLGELMAITRWPRGTCNDTVRVLEEAGRVRRIGAGRGLQWEAVDAIRLERGTAQGSGMAGEAVAGPWIGGARQAASAGTAGRPAMGWAARGDRATAGRQPANYRSEQ